jgi:nucleotide-binding universal stress UspA family protein
MGKPKVMVALRDGASIESLLTLACQLSQGMEGDLVALHVVEIPLVTPLEAADETIDHAGKEVLAQAKRVAEKFPWPLSTELLRAREVGEAMVGVAREQGMDLLVMGHHKPHLHTLSETLLGGIVRYVAHHAPCRVIVQIPAPEHPKSGAIS